MANKKSLKNNLSFEDAIIQLEKIVSKLEESNTSLEESITLFEEGMNLSSMCYDKINHASTKLTKLEERLDDDAIS